MVNTFLISSDFKQSAKFLDWRRLGKQRAEAFQILNIILDAYKVYEYLKVNEKYNLERYWG